MRGCRYPHEDTIAIDVLICGTGGIQYAMVPDKNDDAYTAGIH